MWRARECNNDPVMPEGKRWVVENDCISLAITCRDHGDTAIAGFNESTAKRIVNLLNGELN